MQVLEQKLGEIDDDGTRFDLGEIENVVDEGQEIIARGMDGARELDLPRNEIASRFLHS